MNTTEGTSPNAVGGSALSEGLGPTRNCSHCGFQLPSSGGGLRHYGLHTAHQESECLRLLHAEIERLKTHAVILAATAEEVERERWRAWVEEAVSYVGCETWSPSLKEEGEALLRALGPNAELTGAAPLHADEQTKPGVRSNDR